MAKMKFNMNFGDTPMRMLDGLWENFSPAHVLENYQSGKLARWLDVWNCYGKLEQAQAIQTTGAKEIVSELSRIFGVEANLYSV